MTTARVVRIVTVSQVLEGQILARGKRLRAQDDDHPCEKNLSGDAITVIIKYMASTSSCRAFSFFLCEKESKVDRP
jgi:hypothetical protein